MSGFDTSGVFSPVDGAETAFSGQIIASVTWNDINAQYSDSLTQLGEGQTIRTPVTCNSSGTSYTVQPLDRFIYVSANTPNIVLPACASKLCPVTISGVGTVTFASSPSTLVCNGAETINGSTTQVLSIAYETITLYPRASGGYGADLSSVGAGTVTSVGLSLPGIFTVTNSPVTASGTLTGSLVAQNPNLVWASSSSATITAVPTFRALTSSDIPALSYVTSVAQSMPGIFTVVGSPITSSGTLASSLVSQNPNLVFASSNSGATVAPTFRALVNADLTGISTLSALTSVGTIATGVWQGTIIGVTYGGTGANMSATGGAGQVLKQSSSGTVVSVATLAASELSNGTTGSGAVVLATSGSLTTPALGTPSAAVLTNATGLPFNTGVINAIIIPQGRLTLTSNTPVMVATTAAATTIYYTFYNGNLLPIYDGTNMVPTVFTELSNVTSNSSTGSAGPAAVGNNSNYDLFVWSNSGTPTLTRGPLWTSDTGRGTGAGTTELERIKGVWTNKVAITNGPGANRGTYVGTVRSNGSAQIDYIFGALAASGTAGFFGVWNAYNRVDVSTFVADSTNSWTYAVQTWRAANASNTMRVSFIRGLNEDGMSATYLSFCANSLTDASVGIGIDSTTAFSGTTPYMYNQTGLQNGTAAYAGIPGLGFHFIQAIEVAAVSSPGTTTFYGDIGFAFTQSGMTVTGKT